MKRLPPSRLIRISEAEGQLVQNWKEGVSLQAAASATIDALLLSAGAYRWRLAVGHRRDANVLMRLPKPLYRSATSRFYYAMYHAVRAAVYVFHRGDDHQEHSQLPLNLPADFPNSQQWKNSLKSAREYRNRADYDPHPLSDAAFKLGALQLKAEAAELLPLARLYLVGKGCPL